MDEVRAKRIFSEIASIQCNGWKLADYINCGKSAFVCVAQKDEVQAAIKFFDPELIERYGYEVQQGRIERECGLIGQHHPSLVGILDGGYCPESGLHFIVMEYLPWKNLKDQINDIPSEEHINIVLQLIDACEFLEGLGLCHRDIKPENIAISNDFKTIKLLDFGVIRPFGVSSLTDGTNAKHFVGTLRYSPPEFLLRQETDDLNGWRAVTFYQIGAVIFDLLEKKPLFQEFENPFALLVNAVLNEVPRFAQQNAGLQLASVARIALLKKPEVRIQLLSWQRFRSLSVPTSPEEIRSRVLEKIACANFAVEATYDTRTHSVVKLDEIGRNFEFSLRSEITQDPIVFPPVEIVQSENSDKLCVIHARFAPSVRHSLANCLQIHFVLSWIDQDERAVRIQYRSEVAKEFTDINLPHAAVDQFEEVFTGVYDKSAIEPVVREALYSAIFGAQV